MSDRRRSLLPVVLGVALIAPQAAGTAARAGSAPGGGLAGAGLATTPGDLFTALDPTRLLDTRSGIGAPQARVGPGGTVGLTVAGVAGVPPDAHAVTLNVTGVAPTASTNVSVYPASAAGTPPAVSNLNLPPRAVIANQVLVKVGENGEIRLRNAAGSIDLVADLAGYYADSAATTYAAREPVRVLDTRSGLGAPRAAKIGPAGTVDLQVTGASGVPDSATAVVMNVTATGTTSGTDIRAYPTPAADAAVPSTSNLNVRAGQTLANLVTVRVGDAGRVRLRNAAGSVDLLADVAGYFSPDPDGSTYTALDPVRLLDTRSGLGEAGGARPEGPGGLIDLQLTGSAGMPADATAAVVNLTGISPTASTDLRAYPTPDAGFPLPTVSNVNLSAGQVLPNLVAVAIGAGGRVRLRNSAGAVHLVADLSGYYTSAAGVDHPPAPPAPPTAGVTVSGAAVPTTPARDRTVTVVVTTRPSAEVTATARLDYGISTQHATADAEGHASVNFIADAYYRAGVRVDVRAYDPVLAATGTGTASFTVAGPVGDPTAYAFELADSSGPYRWNPCAAIHYRVNYTYATVGASADLATALSRLRAATGLTFAYDGTTTQVPQSTSPIVAPLVIAWAHSHPGPGYSNLLGDSEQVLGVTQTFFQSPPDAIVDARVVLNVDSAVPPGVGPGEKAVTVLIHELGHAVGLDHVGDPLQVMYPYLNDDSSSAYGAGDLNGLARLGRPAGCLSPAVVDGDRSPPWSIVVR